MKQLGVDAARHQMARSMGHLLELPAKFGIGRKSYAGPRVKNPCRSQRQVLNLLCGRRRLTLGQPAQKPIRPADEILVYIGMPTCRERQIEVMGKRRGQHTDIAGAGDVNQVGLETVEHLVDERNVAQIHGIEAQVFLESDRQKAARQFERPHVSLFDKRFGAVAGAHAQEWQVASPRKCFKVAAGVRHSVHFMK